MSAFDQAVRTIQFLSADICDDDQITTDGSMELSFSEDVLERFEA